MEHEIENHHISPTLWLHLCTREELRQLAQAHGIQRGQNKVDTAHNLQTGLTHNGPPKTFKMKLTIPLP